MQPPHLTQTHPHSLMLCSIERNKVTEVASLGPYVGMFCGKPHSNVWLTIGLAFGIFRQPAYTLKTEKFSDFCASNH